MKTRYHLILIIILISCKPNDQSTFEFDPSSLVENEITLSDIADDINYIPLDNSFPLSSINSAYNPNIVNNCVYLNDKNNGLLIFDKDGIFLRKVGSKGRGPGEYTFCHEFTVDQNTGSVYVYDSDNKIKIYSNNGAFRKSYSLSEYGGSPDVIEIFNSMLFISYQLQYNDDDKYEWIILDTLGNLIKKKVRTIPPFKSNFLVGGGTFIFDQKLNFWNQFIDTVFSFSPDFTYKTNFIFKPGEYRLPKTYIDDPYRQKSLYITMNQIFETKYFLMIRYSFYREKNGFVIIDKKNRESFLSYWSYENYGSITNDLDGGTKFLPRTYFAENRREYLVELIDPYQLKTHVSGNEFKNALPKYPEKKKELEKLANSLKETDNPVLMMVRLKK
jgi:hypothetical protein